jgi:hypothetical protein
MSPRKNYLKKRQGNEGKYRRDSKLKEGNKRKIAKERA